MSFKVALYRLRIHKLCGIYTANATDSEGGDVLVFCSQLIINFFAKDVLRSSRMGRPMTSCSRNPQTPKPLGSPGGTLEPLFV